jgi:SPP1 gp7 family putative phage head morphogenesis protein
VKKQNFIELLTQRKSKSIKKKRKVPPKWLYPINQQKQYDRILYSLVKEIKSKVKEILIPEIPSMIYEVNQNTPNDRNDSWKDRLNSLLDYIKRSIQDKVNMTIGGAGIIGVEIDRFNKRQAEKMNHSIFGFDLFVDEPWLKDQLTLFSSQNAQLIEKLSSDEMDRVSGIVERGLQQGLRFTEIVEPIQKSFGISHRHARLIARDQTSKLNASLTKLRQEEVGITRYRWQTSGDERVRPTHKANDGKIFEWDKPPPITGHPSHDVNCRCVAIPIFEDLD